MVDRIGETAPLRLAAMIAAGPTTYDCLRCWFCFGFSIDGAEPDGYDRHPCVHDEDCPWVLACKLTGTDMGVHRVADKPEEPQPGGVPLTAAMVREVRDGQRRLYAELEATLEAVRKALVRD